MKWMMLLLVLGVAAPAAAKKKPKAQAKPSLVVEGNRNPGVIPPPGDKRTNEGAQGRQNATEDAARSAESPVNERRP